MSPVQPEQRPAQAGKTVRFASPAAQAGYSVILNCILLSPALSPGAKVAYQILGVYARQNEECWPGQEAVAVQVPCTRKTLRTYLAELIEVGLLRMYARQGTTNLYMLCDPPVGKFYPREGGQNLPTSSVEITHEELRTEEGKPSGVASASPSLHGAGTAVKEQGTGEQGVLEGMPPPTPLRRTERRHRASDPLWDMLQAHFGKPTNDNERGRMGRALRLIRQSITEERRSQPLVLDDDTARLQRRLERAQQLWGGKGMAYTEMAIAQNWGLLGRLPAPGERGLTADEVFAQAVAEGLRL